MATPAPFRTPTLPRTGRFRLRKWYLDLVTDAGDAVIVYHAAVRWRWLRLRYASVLHAPADGAARTRTALASAAPALSANALALSMPRLGITGHWRSAQPAAHAHLLDTADGGVLWSCPMPSARASVVLDGHELRGWGYAERLDLTVAPWRLPIRELLWGRFASPSASVVWIQWRGPRPLTLVLLNGAETDARITDTGLEWPGGSLDLAPGRTLRQGRIGSTILRSTPLLRAALPASLRALDEHKLLAPAVLRTAGAEHRGWAIHETVHFQEPAP